MSETMIRASERVDARATSSAGHRVGPRRSDVARESILRATVEVLAERGYQHATIQDIAQRAEVGKTTVYRWWAGKPQLVVEALRNELPPPPVDRGENLTIDLTAAISSLSAAVLDSPLAETLSGLIADTARDRQAETLLEELVGPYQHACLSVLRRARDRGELRHDADVDEIATTITSVVLYQALIGRTPKPGHTAWLVRTATGSIVEV